MCGFCEADISKKHKNAKYCTKKCGARAAYRDNPDKFRAKAIREYHAKSGTPYLVGTQRQCAICETDISDRSGNAKTCSKKCGGRLDYLNNRDNYRALGKVWKANNPEKTRESNRASAERNAEARNARARAAYDPEKEREKKLPHADKIRARTRLYAAANPEKVRIGKRKYKRNRRARIVGSGGSHTDAEWIEIVRLQGGRCGCCGNIEDLHRDHIVPLARHNGSNCADNIEGLCWSCNLAKSARLPNPDDFQPWARQRIIDALRDHGKIEDEAA